MARVIRHEHRCCSGNSEGTWLQWERATRTEGSATKGGEKERLSSRDTQSEEERKCLPPLAMHSPRAHDYCHVSREQEQHDRRITRSLTHSHIQGTKAMLLHRTDTRRNAYTVSRARESEVERGRQVAQFMTPPSAVDARREKAAFAFHSRGTKALVAGGKHGEDPSSSRGCELLEREFLSPRVLPVIRHTLTPLISC